jgi:phage terminase large subunit-like protein
LVVGERNNGGDLVEKNIRSVSRTIPYKSVWATRGKAMRAQPVVALCEQGHLHVVVCLPELEAEMTDGILIRKNLHQTVWMLWCGVLLNVWVEVSNRQKYGGQYEKRS